ncbi:IgaA/UmoB family intracellular growth attenuator [Escherichia coli]
MLHTLSGVTASLTMPINGVATSIRWESTCPLSGNNTVDDENTVELIYTDSLPLVISLDGHTLQEYMQELAAMPCDLFRPRRRRFAGRE